MKFLHIFNCKGGGFFDRVMASIRNNDLFDENEHYFLIRNEEKYNSIQNKNNVILDLQKGSLVSKYDKDFNFFILHSLDSLDEPLQIPKKMRKRVFWRTWGIDAGLKKVRTKRIRVMLARNLRYYKQRRIVNQFCGIGIANLVDEINMKEKYGNKAKLYRFPYITTVQINENFRGNNFHNEKINVLIGHSGYLGDNHIESMKKLLPIKDKVEIFIPLVYGDKEYIKKVSDFANKNFGKNSHILTEHLDFEKYCNLVSKMNFAFFPYTHSYALGNINIALNYSVNMVLNKKGLIARAFEKEKIPYIDFENFDPNRDFHFNVYSIENTAFRKKTDVEKLNELKTVFDLLRSTK